MGASIYRRKEEGTLSKTSKSTFFQHAHALHLSRHMDDVVLLSPMEVATLIAPYEWARVLLTDTMSSSINIIINTERMSGEVKVAASGMWLGIGNGVNLQIRAGRLCGDEKLCWVSGNISCRRTEWLYRKIYLHIWRPVMRMKYCWTICDPLFVTIWIKGV